MLSAGVAEAPAGDAVVRELRRRAIDAWHRGRGPRPLRCDGRGPAGGTAARGLRHHTLSVEAAGGFRDPLGVQELEQLPVRDVQLGDHLLVPRVCRFTLVSAGASLERRDPAAQLALARSLLLPELDGSVDVELAGDVGSGMQRGDGGVRPTLGLDAGAERLRVEGTRHHAHRGRVVDDAQAVRREPPAHLDVDRVVEALVVQRVADAGARACRRSGLPRSRASRAPGRRASRS